MSISTYRWRAPTAVLAGLLTVGLAACGSGATGAQSATSAPATPGPTTTASPTATPSIGVANWPCLKGAGARVRTVAEPTALRVVLLGRSAHVVVLSEESDEDLCSWLPLARTLERDGFAIAMYDYATDPVHDLSAVVRSERAHGARTVAVLGASEGAKTSVIAASKLRPQPNSVVSLSAESALQGTDVAPYAKRVSAPTLYVTASDDPYGSDESTPGYYKSSPAKTKQLLTVPGTAHGTALLSNGRVHRTVTDFLVAHGK